MPTATVEQPASASQTRILRIRYAPVAGPPADTLLRFDDPSPHWALAVAEPLEALPSAEPASPDEELWCIVVDDSDRAARDQAETWINAPGDPPAAEPVRAKLGEGGSILWRPGRAVIHAPAPLRETALKIVAEFNFFESELRKIERDLAAHWSAAQAHAPLAHDVVAKDLRHKKDLATITCRLARWRMAYARIAPHLTLSSPALTAPARRAAAILREQAQVEARLEIADEQIEVYEDLYEAVNQRMGEYANFRKEYIVEWVIVFLLAAELVAMTADLLWNHFFAK